MPEDQERFEDYLELERYLEELQAGHVAHPPENLTPGQARIYRMAALFRSAGPENAEPRPEFAAELQARLEKDLVQSAPTQKMAALRDRRPRQAPGKRVVSRRALLTGGAAVAASMVIGAGVERVVEQAAQGPTPKVPVLPPLVAKDAPTTWFFVTTVAKLGNNAVRFATDTIIGYVIRADKDADAQDRGKIIAMSASCNGRARAVNSTVPATAGNLRNMAKSTARVQATTCILCPAWKRRWWTGKSM